MCRTNRGNNFRYVTIQDMHAQPSFQNRPLFYGVKSIRPQQFLGKSSDFIWSEIYVAYYTYFIEKTTPNQISNFTIFSDIVKIGRKYFCANFCHSKYHLGKKEIKCFLALKLVISIVCPSTYNFKDSIIQMFGYFTKTSCQAQFMTGQVFFNVFV